MAGNLQTQSSNVPTTALTTKLLNVLVCPSDVFEEVAAARHQLRNWLVPTVLVCLANLFLLRFVASPEQTASAVQRFIEQRSSSALEAHTTSSQWYWTSAVATCVAAFLGTFWSALVLWFLGRVCLKARFGLGKAIEVVGLTGGILALGSIMTALLVAACGDPAARPALSLVVSRLPSEDPTGALLEMFNVFYFWVALVLAIGLSRLGRVSLKEAGFWVLGYWVVARFALLLLA